MDGLNILSTAAVGIAGLVLGSFISAYTYRYPRGKSVVSGRSFCPKCKKKIAWYDNIPLFSYLSLLGRCRSCQKKISLRYPLIETACAGGFLGIWYFLTNCVGNASSLCAWYTSLPLSTLLFAFAVYFLLLIVFVIDLEHKIIPDEVIFAGIGLTFAFFLVVGERALYLHLTSGFVAALFLLLIHLATKAKGMGLGDVKFAVFGGFLLGWPETVSWLFLAFLTGAFVGVMLILTKKAQFGKQIPFGPYLVVSLIITLIMGEVLIERLFFN